MAGHRPGSESLQRAHPVFDAHFHIGPYGTQTFAGRRIAPIPEALDHASGADCAAYLDRHGIEAGVIVPTYLDRQEAAFEYNALLIDAVERYPDLYGGLWVSPLPQVESLLEATLARLPHPKVRALKIASNTWSPYGIDPASWDAPVQRNVERILESAGAHGLVIHFHTGYLPGADPLEFDRFMQRYGSRATYQLVHCGEAIAPAFRFAPRFPDWIEQGFDVYTDTSVVPGFAPRWLLRELDRRNLGFGRVLFATDTPWGFFPAEYWKIAGLDLDPEAKEQIFRGNAARLYGVE